MRMLIRFLPVCLFLLSCGNTSSIKFKNNPDFVIAFGSCNRQDEVQPLWNIIIENKPNVFLWGGDNIYSDTDKAQIMKADYEKQKSNLGYQKLLKSVPVFGTWDDHDYGLNDGGKEWKFKEESQQLFLDFMDVPEDSPRRDREGVYHAEVFETLKGSVKVIFLDTRYFRDELIPSEDESKRYEPSRGTILGEKQWKWLTEELQNSQSDFNIILSSIQILSVEHGFETWGNFPSEIEKLKDLIVSTKAENVIILSGDRHISEFSEVEVEGLAYPLVDFTSSGLTHTYEEFTGEPNKNRIGEVVKEKSFGLLKLNFSQNKVLLEMRGEHNKLLQQHSLDFK